MEIYIGATGRILFTEQMISFMNKLNKQTEVIHATMNILELML